MAAVRTDENCARNNCHDHDDGDDDGDDRPPPIPPRPSWTFAARRDVLPPPAARTALQTHVHTDTTPEVMSSGSKTPDDTRAGEGPVPPPRNESKQSPDELPGGVDVGRDKLLSPAVYDEVFLTCDDTDTVHADKTTVHQHLTTEHRGNDIAAESKSVVSEVQPQCVSEDQLPSSTSCVTGEQSSANSLCDGLPTALVNAETVSTSDDAGPCGETADDAGSQSQVAVSSESSVNTVETGLHEPTASVHHEPGQARSSASPDSRVPVVSFSEFEDFGLDPDLFRPHCLESDVPFSEQTAKFTRSASPLYEPVMDEDETGNCSFCR